VFENLHSSGPTAFDTGNAATVHWPMAMADAAAQMINPTAF
jgi:hypothetical protein